MKLLKNSAIILLVGFIIFMAGPRVETDVHIKITSIPDDVETYINQQEARFDDITEDTEKTIIWADSVNRQTEYAVVSVHGYTATRQETAPLADSLAAKLGANLYYTRLTAHGRPGTAFETVTANDWFNDIAETIEIGRKIGKKVILVGTSHGGMLSLWAAANLPQDNLEALLLISPNFHPVSPASDVLLWPWGKQLSRAIVGEEATWVPSNELQAKYWTTQYHSNGLLQMMAGVSALENSDLSQITTPVLICYSMEDNVVDPKVMLARFDKIGSAKKKHVEIFDVTDRQNHVLAGEILSSSTTPVVLNEMLSFLDEI